MHARYHTSRAHSAVICFAFYPLPLPFTLCLQKLCPSACPLVCAAEGATEGKSWGLSLSQFKQLSPQEQVLLLIPEGEATSEDAAATAQRAAKLMAVSAKPQDTQQLLVELVKADAARHLPWLAHIFERLRLQRQVNLPIPVGVALLLHLPCRCTCQCCQRYPTGPLWSLYRLGDCEGEHLLGLAPDV